MSIDALDAFEESLLSAVPAIKPATPGLGSHKKTAAIRLKLYGVLDLMQLLCGSDFRSAESRQMQENLLSVALPMIQALEKAKKI